jgi:hypothetical protein
VTARTALSVTLSAVVLFTNSCGLAPSETSTEVVAGATDGWKVPEENENSDHGYLLQDSRIPRLASCDEWDRFWIHEGPAVSFGVASAYAEPELAVSTQIYQKNRHLDLDKDGVVCFYENEPKPLNLAKSEGDEADRSTDHSKPWVRATLSVRESINFDSAGDYPLDFASSPSVVKSHAASVRKGVELALRFWAPYIDSTRPLAMTVVHPNDKTWFLKRWDELGRDNTGEFWWNLAKDGGGGAVGWTESGIPNMYFMASEDFPPPSGPMDYYVHEVTHFFQTLTNGDSSNEAAPCWYAEGTATFIGHAMTYPTDEARTMEEFVSVRKERAKNLMNFYETVGGPSQARLERDILKFPEGDPTCQHETPQFGYNLGMFVAEKLIFDFGFDSFIEMSKGMGGQNLASAFESVNGIDYQRWVKASLIPYIIENLLNEAG